MDDETRKKRLTESLQKAVELNTLVRSSGYVNYLLPYLMELARVHYIDPTKYKTKEEYDFALDKANMRAGAYAELINFLGQQEAIMNKIRQELQKPPVAYGI